MNTEQLKALGARAVACRGWRWLPGMLDLEGDRVAIAEGHDMLLVNLAGDAGETDVAAMAPPDLSDPATLGCVEHGLLPEAWGEHSCVGFQPDPDGGGGWLYITATANPEADTPDGLVGPLVVQHEHRGATKAEAALAALEAAPHG